MPKNDRQPNIVWLLTDHHVFKHHVDLPGPGPDMQTYRRLCEQGIEFSNAYSVCPLCTPARASMLTGVFPHRHGMIMNNGACGSKLEFEQDEKLFSSYLRDAGYRVGYFGKWHCGVERTALDYGFEGWTMPGYGHPYWSEEYARYLEELGLSQAVVDVDWHYDRSSLVGEEFVLKDEEPGLIHMASSGRMKTPAETHEAYFVTHLANRWLEKVAETGEPFCLRVDVWGPHQPYYVGEPFADRTDPGLIVEYPSFSSTLEGKPESHKHYRDSVYRHCRTRSWADWSRVIARAYDHVRLVDAALGSVLDTLERLGIVDDTIVIYTADHGDAIGSHGGVFDKDSVMLEETSRIPFCIRWPGKVPGATVTQKLVTNMDLVPTVLEAAGAEIPVPMDGRSVLRLAREGGNASWRDDVMCTHHGHGRPCFQRMLRWRNMKYVAHLDDLDELYDLDVDPYELRNVIEKPSMKDVLGQMRQRLLRWMDECNDNEADSQKLRKQMS